MRKKPVANVPRMDPRVENAYIFPTTLPVLSRLFRVSLTTTGEIIPRRQEGTKKMIVVIRRIRSIRLVWKWAGPTRLVRGEMIKAPKPERNRSQPRVED